jgi:hypothetical protein
MIKYNYIYVYKKNSYMIYTILYVLLHIFSNIKALRQIHYIFSIWYAGDML